jgi:hypothetical protein
MWKLHEFGALDLEFKKIITPLRKTIKGFETFRKGCLLNCVSSKCVYVLLLIVVIYAMYSIYK